MKFFDVNAWIGSWPFRTLRDNTPAALLARLERVGITHAAVSSVEAATKVPEFGSPASFGV